MESVRSAFHAQLATVMDSLLAAAVCEIAKIFEGSLCEQQAELSQKTEEISILRCKLEKVERRHKTKGTEEREVSSRDTGGSLKQHTAGITAHSLSFTTGLRRAHLSRSAEVVTSGGSLK